MSETPTYVWVVTESIPYEGELLYGVYVSAEAAMQEWPGPWELVGQSDPHVWLSRGAVSTMFVARHKVRP